MNSNSECKERRLDHDAMESWIDNSNLSGFVTLVETVASVEMVELVIVPLLPSAFSNGPIVKRQKV